MKKIFVLFFTLIILTGCFNNDSDVDKELIYTGEADNWKATVVSIISDDLDEADYFMNVKYTMRIEYKGDLADLKDIHKWGYSYEYGLTKLSRSENLANVLNSKVATVYEETGMIKEYLNNEQTTIPFKIEWNGKVEEFELKINK